MNRQANVAVGTHMAAVGPGRVVPLAEEVLASEDQGRTWAKGALRRGFLASQREELLSAPSACGGRGPLGQFPLQQELQHPSLCGEARGTAGGPAGVPPLPAQ